ncbi:hypothetical protein HK097_011243, partial [Rhizophlyctis rosea]
MFNDGILSSGSSSLRFELPVSQSKSAELLQVLTGMQQQLTALEQAHRESNQQLNDKLDSTASNTVEQLRQHADTTSQHIITNLTGTINDSSQINTEQILRSFQDSRIETSEQFTQLAQQHSQTKALLDSMNATITVAGPSNANAA